MVAYSFKKRFVVPIRVGLGLDQEIPDLLWPKLQTVRALGRRRHARPGEDLQLYHGMRTPDCFLIGRSICTETNGIRIQIGENHFRIRLNGETSDLSASTLRDFARADGFVDHYAMHDFWCQEHPGVADFIGVAIKWRAMK